MVRITQSITCCNILTFSSGAVAVLDTTPPNPPAMKARQIGTDAGGKGAGARSVPISTDAPT